MDREKLKHIVTASRQLLFHNHIDGYDYSLGGSSFLVRINSVFYILTAKHVLDNNSYSANDALVRYNDKGRDLLPFDDQFTITTKLIDDTDHMDIIFLKVSSNLLEKNIDIGFFVDLPLKRELPPLKCDQLLISGFPKDLCQICYKSKTLKHVRKAFTGNNKQLTAYHGIYQFEYQIEDDVSKNGLSGSPVFCLNNKNNSYRIDGVLLRENYYLSFNVIQQYLFEITLKT